MTDADTDIDRSCGRDAFGFDIDRPAVTDEELAEFVASLGDDDVRVYGQPRGERPFRSSMRFDGDMVLAPRRPELLGDAVDTWWLDVMTWGDWMVATFHVERSLPECWPRHAALVEEMLALWLNWQSVWLPCTDAAAPIGFLRELDWAIGRIERLWKTPCTAGNHKNIVPITIPSTGEPELHPWWSNPNYPGEEQPND